STTPSRTAPRTTRRQSTPRRQRLPTPVYQGEKRVYLGPQIGAFVPVGEMADIFESSFGYGGIIGAQFRKNLDVCLQFFFAAKKDEWSFWNLQLLGRRYLNTNVLFDFGYGITYPEYVSHGLYGGGGNIQLGLSLGLTYNAPFSSSTWFEMGVLYQYYPNFAEHAGQFFTIQGRLLL
ncbi:MAG TPA: hypothetical protein VGB38_09245, partial [bacterium]